MSQSVMIGLIVIAAVVVIAIVGVLARPLSGPRLRALPDESKDRYAHSWHAIEARFIDDPRGAVGDADKMAAMILAERGANLAEDKKVPEDLRRAREGGTQDTEGMRRSMTHYKHIVDDAVGSDRMAPEHGRREVAS